MTIPHTEDTKEMTVEKILKDIDFWKSQERNGHSFEEMSQAVEALKESVLTTLTLFASQVREERDREIVDKFKTLCTVNEDGDCKYFRDDIHERLLRGEKFIAQEIITTLTQKT